MEQIKHKHSDVPVLILIMHPGDQYAVRTLKSGAAGYLTKESASQELVNALPKVLCGGKYTNASLAEQLLFNLSSEGERPRTSSFQTASIR